jgi:hypothetical protein
MGQDGQFSLLCKHPPTQPWGQSGIVCVIGIWVDHQTPTIFSLQHPFW